MSKFIKGDKVIAKDVGTNRSITEGKEYTIVDIETAGVKVVNDNGDQKFYYERRFEKVAKPTVATAAPNLFAGNFGTGKGTTDKIRKLLAVDPAGALDTQAIGAALNTDPRQLSKRLRELVVKNQVRDVNAGTGKRAAFVRIAA